MGARRPLPPREAAAVRVLMAVVDADDLVVVGTVGLVVPQVQIAEVEPRLYDEVELARVEVGAGLVVVETLAIIV